MAAAVKDGPVNWTVTQDEEGHRDYKVLWLVESTRDAGPRQVMLATGLPQPGDPWSIYGGAAESGGTGATDIDQRATCRRNMTVKRTADDNQGARYWHVEQTFSTKPSKRCRDEDSENPLEIADRVSGGSTRFTEEGVADKDGERIVNSAHELIRGPLNEWDANRHQIVIEQNRATLGAETLVPLLDGVNDRELWGFPPRTIKFSDFQWEKKFYSKEIPDEVGTGVTYDHCATYYVRRLTLEIRYRWKPIDPLLLGTGTGTGEGQYETWDRYLLDEGTKVLRGEWDTDADSPTYKGWILKGSPDPDNPKDFIKAVDFTGNPTKLILDGHGRPYDSENATTGTGDDRPGQIFVQYYDEYDLAFYLDLPETI